MADIHIERPHGMSMGEARQTAAAWASEAETKFDMACTCEQSEALDTLRFARAGVSGTLTVTPERFELQAKLGFLLGAFKTKIEGDIIKNLDALIAQRGVMATAAAPALVPATAAQAAPKRAKRQA